MEYRVNSEGHIMAVCDAHVFPVLTQIPFQSHRLLFSQASAEVRGENTPQRNFASTGSRTHHHQVMSPTCSQMSHPGGANNFERDSQISIFLIVFFLI